MSELIAQSAELRAAFGSDYLVKPDVIVARKRVTDEEINQDAIALENSGLAQHTPFRAANEAIVGGYMLHASLSCKWIIRSDRSQNARTEALNLIRNRKGHTPHIVAVTAEPLPMRIASLALGTGDLDCVYHIALPELQRAVEQTGNEDQLAMLHDLITGQRLRDISDLPFDLAA